MPSQPEARRPQEPADVPRRPRQGLVGEPAARLEHQDAVALLDEPQRRHGPAEPGPDDHDVVLGHRTSLGQCADRRLDAMREGRETRPDARRRRGRRDARARPRAVPARGAARRARTRTGRCRCGTGRPARSRAPSRRCSGCSRCRWVRASWTSAPARAGRRRCSRGSSDPTGSCSGSSWTRSSPSGARRTSPRATCPWARIERATPGALGRPVDGGWDRILVSASPRSLPTVLVDQLADGGRLVIPVRSTMHLVERAGGSDTCHHARLVHLRAAALSAPRAPREPFNSPEGDEWRTCQ